MNVLTASIDVVRNGGFSVPTLEQVENSDAILILGEDISNTAPRIALSVRQATRLIAFDLATGAGIPTWQDAGVRGHAQHTKNPLYIATPASTRLDEIATDVSSGTVSELVNLANSIAETIESNTETNGFASSVAKSLLDAKAPLVITGCSLRNVSLIQAAARIARALQHHSGISRFIAVPPEANSYGVALLGEGISLSQVLSKLSSGGRAIILENDLYRRAKAPTLDGALASGECVALDSLETRTLAKSHCVFPASSYAEQTGTFVNYEMRAQRFYQVFEPKGETQPSWRWLSSIAKACGRNEIAWNSLDALLEACAESTFAEIRNVAPGPDYRLAAGSQIPRQTHRYSGRTAMFADHDVHEPKSSLDDETPFTYSMEGQNPEDQNGATIPYSWSPGWNSNQSVFKFQQEVGGSLAGGDPGVRLITVPSTSAGDLESRQAKETPTSNNGNGSLQLVPIHHVFGSDEMSSYSWPIRQRMYAPFVLLSKVDAERMGLQEGMGVTLAGGTYSFEVRIDARLAEGLLGLPRGITEIDEDLESRVEITHDPDFVKRLGPDVDVIARG